MFKQWEKYPLSDPTSHPRAFAATAQQYWWFPHMHSHLQPHNFDNLTDLENEMLLNKAFAEVTAGGGIMVHILAFCRISIL